MYALIATHNTALRSAISVLLRICHPGCNIVMANDVGDVHALLEAGQCDTMLVDTQFSGYGSAFDVDMLRRYYPHVNFLPLASAGDIPPGMDVPPGLDVLDSELDDPMPHAALAHGLAGSPPARAAATSVDHLLRAIQVIGSAEVVAGPPRVRFAEPAAESSPALTARQRDVLSLLGEGRSTKDIARRLGLAVPTVKTHLAALYRQLGARNRVEAVVKAGMPRNVRPARPRQAGASAFHDTAFAYGTTMS